MESPQAPNLLVLTLPVFLLMFRYSKCYPLAPDLVYNSDHHPTFSRTHFKKLLTFATAGEFLFNGKMYRQIDGLSMGGCLSPTLANLFLGHFEESWLSSAIDKPKYYKRYVDDTFLLIDDDFQIEKFLTHMNSVHPNIKLTYEVEDNNSLFFS